MLKVKEWQKICYANITKRKLCYNVFLNNNSQFPIKKVSMHQEGVTILYALQNMTSKCGQQRRLAQNGPMGECCDTPDVHLYLEQFLLKGNWGPIEQILQSIGERPHWKGWGTTRALQDWRSLWAPLFVVSLLLVNASRNSSQVLWPMIYKAPIVLSPPRVHSYT